MVNIFFVVLVYKLKLYRYTSVYWKINLHMYIHNDTSVLIHFQVFLCRDCLDKSIQVFQRDSYTLRR